MGSQLSAQQQKWAAELNALLKKYALPFENKDVIQFVKTMGLICPWVEQDGSGTTDLEQWDKIGKALQSKTPVTMTQPQSLTPRDLASVAAPKGPLEQIDPEPPPLYGETLPFGSEPPTPHLNSLPQRDLSRTIAVAQLMAEEEEPIPSLYPIIRGRPAVGSQPAVLDRNEPLALEYIKALHKSVKMNGTQAPYTKVLLNNIGEQRLIPKDWDQLASGISPPPGDLLLFKVEWRRLAVNKAQQNRTANINITLQMLVGEGNHVTTAQQIALTHQALEQVAAIVIRAWTSLPQKGDPTSTAVSSPPPQAVLLPVNSALSKGIHVTPGLVSPDANGCFPLHIWVQNTQQLKAEEPIAILQPLPPSQAAPTSRIMAVVSVSDSRPTIAANGVELWGFVFYVLSA
ncbi:hypothetical protein JRQ81_017996 [Phrynocephalus forsythii]|uniref:Beta-retroviral matrix protein domain-containing protein n=1 Tax=Phrynocephalus forsythii TaxID=171643 RepID=A0A9Q0XRE2_9SAUR|nr:hypothetical protein JRQ81_017996 [Phrynocephalus forsythii]